MALVYINNQYQLMSYLGGMAYEIVRLWDGASVFLQGDEASDFRDEFDAAEAVSEACVNSLFSAYDDVMRNKFEE